MPVIKKYDTILSYEYMTGVNNGKEREERNAHTKAEVVVSVDEKTHARQRLDGRTLIAVTHDAEDIDLLGAEKTVEM